MTAHLQGSDQRLFGENADVLLAQCVQNVGQFARTDVVWPCIHLALYKDSRSERAVAEHLVCT